MGVVGGGRLCGFLDVRRIRHLFNKHFGKMSINDCVRSAEDKHRGSFNCVKQNSDLYE